MQNSEREDDSVLLLENYDHLSVETHITLRSSTTFSELSKHKFPDLDYIYSIESSCDGILCLGAFYSRKSNYKVLLWNPVTNQLKELPPPLIQEDRKYLMGFGHNSLNRYIIVQICQRTKDHSVQIFRFETNSWTIFQSRAFTSGTNDEQLLPSIVGMDGHDSHAVLCGGHFNWLAKGKITTGEDRFWPEGANYSIISFDIDNQILDFFSAPIGIGERKYVKLGTCKDKLSIFSYDIHEVEIWILEEYAKIATWKKYYTLNLAEECASRLKIEEGVPIWIPLYFSSEEAILRHPNFEITLFNFSRPEMATKLERGVKNMWDEVTKAISHIETMKNPSELS